MNILFLTREDPENIHTWSGTLYYIILYHIYRKLKENHYVEVIGIEILNQRTLFTKGNFHESKFVPADRYIKSQNRLLSERINAKECDLIFYGDLLFVPYLDVNFPIVYLYFTRHIFVHRYPS
jgi:hypothetical protein